MTDRVTLKDVIRVAKSLTPSLIKAQALEPGEKLVVARDETDNVIAVEVQDANGERTAHHSGLDMLGYNGRLSTSTRESYFILCHLAPVIHAWGLDVQENVRLREELKEANR